MDHLKLMCRYEEDACVISVGRGGTYDVFVSVLSARMPCLASSTLKLYYTIPTYARCFLFGEDDYGNMYPLAMALNVAVVFFDVEVVSSLVGESSSGSDGRSRPSGCLLLTSSNDELDLLPSLCRPEPNEFLTFAWEKCISYVNQKFDGGAKEFRAFLKKLSVATGYNFKYVKNDRSRIKVRCVLKEVTGCGWMISGRLMERTGCFYVKNINPVHTCGSSSRSLKFERMDPDLISTLICDQVRLKGSVSAKNVKQILFTQYGVNVPYKAAWVAVEKANKLVFGNELQSFQFLDWYVNAALESNHGSRIVLDIVSRNRQFQRIFVAFDACIKGFNFCRPIIFLDGTFLKSKFKGQLLVATAKDGESGLYPVAFVVVNSETKDNWIWFLQHLRSIVNLDRNITFVSDRNLGLISACRIVFPECSHGYCLQHLKMNFRDKFSKSWCTPSYRDHMVRLLTRCAYVPTVSQFETSMAKLLHDGKGLAQSFFTDLSPSNWANAYFKGTRYGEMTSNAAESFNSWIEDERNIPIANMIDAIRVKIMKQISDRSAESGLWGSVLCPTVDRILGECIDKCRNYVVIRSSTHVFEVSCPPITVKVDLSMRTCCCGGWQMNKLPCSHAVCCILQSGSQLTSFLEDWCMRETFVKCYSFPILPIPTYDKPLVVEPEDAVFPPSTKRPPGRQRKIKYPSVGDRTKVAKIKCGRCGKLALHNRRTCTAPL